MTVFSNDIAYTDMLNLITAGGNARRKKMADTERAKIESGLAEHVRRIMPDQLKAEAERSKRAAASIDKAAAQAFAQWVRDRELFLPITGETAAAYIIDLLLAEDADMARLRAAAQAITHIHDIGQMYLDQKPIAAAIKFCEVVRGLADGGDDGGGETVTPDNPPSPPANDYEPLAAAGA